MILTRQRKTITIAEFLKTLLEPISVWVDTARVTLENSNNNMSSFGKRRQFSGVVVQSTPALVFGSCVREQRRASNERRNRARPT